MRFIVKPHFFYLFFTYLLITMSELKARIIEDMKTAMKAKKQGRLKSCAHDLRCG
jgi:hypothetical protein